jgi:protein phosphatase
MNFESGAASRQGTGNTLLADAILNDAAHGLFAVADGVGDTPAAARASAIALETLRKHWEGAAAIGMPAERLREAFLAANAALRAVGEFRLHTTLTAAALCGPALYLAHCGDSRAYLCRSKSVKRLTEDHTLVADLVRDRLIPEQTAQDHPRRSILSACLGLYEHCKVQTSCHELAPGQIVVLCTDGISAHLSDEQIATCARSLIPPTAIASALLDHAIRNGSGDDASAVVIRSA